MWHASRASDETNEIHLELEQMRRSDVQLRSLARQGDHDALCEVGHRYLRGARGFPKYTDLGLKYLSHPTLSKSDRASKIIAESLPLSELIKRDLLIALTIAAHAGSGIACLKLGVWRAFTRKDGDAARRMWVQSQELGCDRAASALKAYDEAEQNPPLAAVTALVKLPEIEANASVAFALTSAVNVGKPELIVRAIDFAITLPLQNTSVLCDAVCEGMLALQRLQIGLPSLDSTRLQSMLEDCVRRGNSAAALMLGRALCGIDTAFAESEKLAPKRNLRGGTALLLRAADAGMSDAWLLLHHVHANGQGSVANPQAAKFFLEKAASTGNVNAQRQLGAMILKSAIDISEFELGMHWLSQASTQGDAIAKSLLRTFVLPVHGSEQEADDAVEEMMKIDPWIAHRLRTSRNFGLTRTEAMNIDLISGTRSWGLVVSSEAADHRLRAPFSRTIPALEPKYMDQLREAVDFFRTAEENGAIVNGERRQRPHSFRYVLERISFDEHNFFAQVPTAKISAFRQGPSWAHGVRNTLRTALLN